MFATHKIWIILNILDTFTIFEKGAIIGIIYLFAILDIFAIFAILDIYPIFYIFVILDIFDIFVTPDMLDAFAILSSLKSWAIDSTAKCEWLSEMLTHLKIRLSSIEQNWGCHPFEEIKVVLYLKK